MQPTTATLIVAGLGIGGTLGGIVVGHFLTRSWERQQWLLDNRKEEFRELLSALADSYTRKLSVRPMVALDPKQQQANETAQVNIFRVSQDRIYIASDVKSLEVDKRWTDALREYEQSYNAVALGSAYKAICKDLVEAALKKNK